MAVEVQDKIQTEYGGRGLQGPQLLVGVGSDGPRRISGPLRNRYFVVRHGQSLANVQEKIVSSPENGIGAFGLTEEGLQQARRAAEQLRAFPSVRIYTSPFLRCIETAEIIARQIGVPEVVWAPELRERHFGGFEGGHKRFYGDVYNADRAIPGNKFNGVESTDEVAERGVSLVEKLETRSRGRSIVFVTHADVGEILQATFAGQPSHEHRSLPKLKNAELRELRLSTIRQ